ncbi:MAG: ATP-dependent DNA helicase [Desulfarculaceae bacterium]|nr:ATP-dependent DNA helicase [Desulfarculaceae bacterium]MCF8073116.1 ATP-dependent DNA helicase [Desulfarculaceae bacterium]MCF8101799.1 ATP-dependent DNA helicase [Desulfarculaceae bacterium]MCF8117363.1 ATP-dependent DNA helicase [Desulfarculaceae bacterium]
MSQSSTNDDQAWAETWLGADSPLAEFIPAYAPRQGQVDMAAAVNQALRQQTPLVVEAGTGTGKTLAYLLPAVASGLKVVVSTGTRTLQDQINLKELPLVQRGLAPELKWAVLKGRTNYLCQRRYLGLAAQPDLSLPGAGTALARLNAWLEDSESGDLDEVRGQGLHDAFLAEVTSNSEQCLGGRCPTREHCFLMEARRRAAEADIVVVNHHLFLADLVLKAGGHGEALPRYQAVVFDEAHLLPEVATAAFGVGLGAQRLSLLLRDVLKELPREAEAAAAAGAVEAAGKALFNRLRKLLGPGGRVTLSPEQLERLAPASSALREALGEMAKALPKGKEAAEALADRAQALARDLEAAAQPVPGHSVAWAESRGGVRLHLSPVEVGPHLQQALYGHLGRLVFTSATLAPLDDLTPFCARLGLPSETRQKIVASPFDPASQALLYVPRKMPPPNSEAFPRAVATQVRELLAHSRGRAFVLFTSHRNLKEVSGLLADELPFPMLVQGQAPRLELLKRFVDQSPSVLFATASFWQGVDVPGPALSAVIVDKLPFAPPDDPLVAARCQRLEEEDGKSGFAHLLLPEAILSLKQGLGRLLRTPSDRGLLAVLDVRLVSKGYGKRFLKALAPVPLTHNLEDVARFFEGEEAG